MPGTLFVVATPIGNLEDITVRALRILREVAVIAAEDTRRTAHLLARHAIATPTTSLHEHNEAGKSATLVERLLRGDSIRAGVGRWNPDSIGPRGFVDPGGYRRGGSDRTGAWTKCCFGRPRGFWPSHRRLCVRRVPTDWGERQKGMVRTGKGDSRDRGVFRSSHRIQATLNEIAREISDCQAVVCRELTKVHEELVRGPISEIANVLATGRGEYTVVLHIDLTADITAIGPPTARNIADEFGVMTNNSAITRRKAISNLARKHGLAPNVVYEMLEAVKKSG